MSTDRPLTGTSAALLAPAHDSRDDRGFTLVEPLVDEDVLIDRHGGMATVFRRGG